NTPLDTSPAAQVPRGARVHPSEHESAGRPSAPERPRSGTRVPTSLARGGARAPEDSKTEKTFEEANDDSHSGFEDFGGGARRLRAPAGGCDARRGAAGRAGEGERERPE